MTALEFGYTIDRLSGSLRPFALRLTKDMEDANDLLQETIRQGFLKQREYTLKEQI
jgi:DNA-directed RNA polymerase specialized sigma24 family protein